MWKNAAEHFARIFTALPMMDLNVVDQFFSIFTTLPLPQNHLAFHNLCIFTTLPPIEKHPKLQSTCIFTALSSSVATPEKHNACIKTPLSSFRGESIFHLRAFLQHYPCLGRNRKTKNQQNCSITPASSLINACFLTCFFLKCLKTHAF